MDDVRGFEANFMAVAAEAACGELALHRQGLVEVKKGRRTLGQHQVHFYRRVDVALVNVEVPHDLSRCPSFVVEIRAAVLDGEL